MKKIRLNRESGIKIGGKIFIYFPEIKDKVDLIKALLHEYRHYLQPRWGYEFYTHLGYKYKNHPYELEAISEEKNYKLFK